MADYDEVTIRRAENGYIVTCVGDRGALAPTFVFNHLGGMQSEGCLVQWLAQNMPLERKSVTGLQAAQAAWSNVFGGSGPVPPGTVPPPTQQPTIANPYSTAGAGIFGGVRNVRSKEYMAQAARALGASAADLDEFLEGSS